MSRWRPLSTVGMVLLAVSPAWPGGGSRNVLVVVNEQSEESLEIGNHYLRARGIPAANLCRIRTAPNLTTDKATYQAEIESGVAACIAGSPYRSRIDYLVLTRGIPISASFPDLSNPPTSPVSTTALLEVMETPLRGKDQEYGGPTYGFQFYPNPYLKRSEYFSHGKLFGGYKLYLATMLSGYWSEHARALVDRSLASDGKPPTATGGTFFLEDGVPAADVRNVDFPAAAATLRTLGFNATHVLNSDPEVTGAVVASHVNSGSYSSISKAVIDSNTYPPGCIVDVLESYGLTPTNFTPGGADQTPVTWWIAAGATGGHGTVAEPYNVAFPDGRMLEPYVAGYNLAETYYQGIPYLYWMNLVLGDPLAAPWATPPAVTIRSPAAKSTVSGNNVQLRATATTPRPEGISGLEFFVDDVLIGAVAGSSGLFSWDSTTVPDGWHRFEVVGWEATARYTQATAGIDFRVDNRGRSIALTSVVAGSRVAGTFAATVETVGPIVDVAVTAEGYGLGTATGTTPFTVNLDTTLLGRGWHTLVAEGGTGPSWFAVSAGVDIYVVKAPRVNTFGPPVAGPQSGGTVVPIDGWNFEPDIQVLFGGRPAQVVVVDANHLTVTAPTGPPGAVAVTLVNPLGLTQTLPAAFTYTASTCPASDTIAQLLAVRDAAGLVHFTWTGAADPCWESYRFFAAADPASPPRFPQNYADVTASDLDGNPGGDASFVFAPPSGRRILFAVASQGTDGTLGP